MNDTDQSPRLLSGIIYFFGILSCLRFRMRNKTRMQTSSSAQCSLLCGAVILTVSNSSAKTDVCRVCLCAEMRARVLFWSNWKRKHLAPSHFRITLAPLPRSNILIFMYRYTLCERVSRMELVSVFDIVYPAYPVLTLRAAHRTPHTHTQRQMNARAANIFK